MATQNPRSYGIRTCQAASLQNDYSVNGPAIPGALNLLTTIPVNPNRIGYVIQQQSGNALTVVFDDGVASTPTVVLMNPSSAGVGGDNLGMVGLPHYGRIRIFGAVGSAVAAADW